MRDLQGRIGLITGAAGGIGRALAEALADRGMHLWLVDVDPLRLKHTCDAIRTRGVHVRPILADLSQRDHVDDVVDRVLDSTWGVDLLINNAGIAYYGGTHQMADEQWDRVMAVNLDAPVHITRRLLPLLRRRPEAHIVNMCSVAGLVAGGRFTAYHTSKFGLVGFTLALRAEYGRKGLGVTAVCPGPCRTDLYHQCETDDGERAPQPPRWLATTPDRVAAATIRGILKNRRQVVLTPVGHSLHHLQRYFPGLLDLVHTFSRRRLPWYRGKPLHVPTSFPPQDPSVEDRPVDATVPFPIKAQRERSDSSRRRSA